MALPEPPGEAQLVFGPLRIWILGREFPHLHDYWDGNWIEIDARCAAATGEGRVAGAIMMLPDLQRWSRQLRELGSSGKREAALSPIEPELWAGVKLRESEVGVLTVEFRTWDGELDDWVLQTWLAPVEPSELARWIAAIDQVLVTYPIRGKL